MLAISADGLASASLPVPCPPHCTYLILQRVTVCVGFFRYYAKTMERIQAKGKKYVASELARLERLLAAGNVSAEKRCVARARLVCVWCVRAYVRACAEGWCGERRLWLCATAE